MSNIDASQLALEFARLAWDYKAEDILVFDLRGISQVMDYVVICTGTSDRQMRAIADRVQEYARKVGEKPYGVSGVENAAWILLDFVDVVVHVFDRPYRDYYGLEMLWGDAPRMQWQRSESA